MKLSIIVPVYNAELYIHRCVKSLLDQSLTDYEIILVNDGSNDHSTQIIRDYEHKYPNLIKVIHQKNGGVGKARNAGLEVAKGEYFTYIDSDDYVESDCFKEIYELAYQNDYDLLIYDAYKDSGENKEIIYASKLTKDERISPNIFILSLPCPWNKIMKLSMVREHNIKFPEGVWYEDLALIPTLALYTNKIGYLHKPMVNYFLSPNSITRQTSFNKKALGIFPVMDILYNTFHDTEYKEELESLFIYHLLSQSSLEFYRAGEYEYINKISFIMHEKFPNWRRNKYNIYESKECIRYATIFYYRMQRLLNILQHVKKLGKRS